MPMCGIRGISLVLSLAIPTSPNLNPVESALWLSALSCPMLNVSDTASLSISILGSNRLSRSPVPESNCCRHPSGEHVVPSGQHPPPSSRPHCVVLARHVAGCSSETMHSSVIAQQYIPEGDHFVSWQTWSGGQQKF